MQISLNEEMVVCPLFESLEQVERWREYFCERGWDWFHGKYFYRLYWWTESPTSEIQEGCFGFYGHKWLESFDRYLDIVKKERIFQNARFSGFSIVQVIDF